MFLFTSDLHTRFPPTIHSFSHFGFTHKWFFRSDFPHRINFNVFYKRFIYFPCDSYTWFTYFPNDGCISTSFSTALFKQTQEERIWEEIVFNVFCFLLPTLLLLLLNNFSSCKGFLPPEEHLSLHHYCYLKQQHLFKKKIMNMQIWHAPFPVV